MGEKSVVEEYLQKSLVCEALAVNARTESGRQTYLDLAASWRRMAEQEANAKVPEHPRTLAL